MLLMEKQTVLQKQLEGEKIIKMPIIPVVAYLIS